MEEVRKEGRQEGTSVRLEEGTEEEDGQDARTRKEGTKREHTK